MTMRHRLVSFDSGNDLVVLVHTRENVAGGKFLLGRHLTETNLKALVLDDAAGLYADIARKHHMHPLGGGMFDVDSDQLWINLYGASKAFGPEPNRETTRRALKTAFPDWQITVE